MRLFSVAFLIVLFVPLVAPAQAQVINACVNKSGSMRIVSDPAECKGSETPLSWNAEGPIGPQGPEGPVGEPGRDAILLRVIDGNANDLGALVDWITPKGSIDPFVVFYNEPLDTTVKVIRGTGQMDQGWDVYYETTNCTGQGFVFRMLANVLVPVESYSRFFVGRDGPLVFTTYGSRSTFSGCAVISGGPSNLLPADEVTGSVPFSFPLTLPVSILPEGD